MSCETAKFSFAPRRPEAIQAFTKLRSLLGRRTKGVRREVKFEREVRGEREAFSPIKEI